MIGNNSREFNQVPSLNSSKVQSMAHSYIQPNSKANLLQLKNDFAIHYPCQPRESCSIDLQAFENDLRDAQLVESLSNRSNSDRFRSHIIQAERKKITSPSLKKRRKYKQSLVVRFIEKMKISNNNFIKNEFVQALILDKALQTNAWLKFKKQQFFSFDLVKSIKFPFSRYGLFRKFWKFMMRIVYVTILIFSSLMLLYPQRECFQQVLLLQLIMILINTVLNLHTCFYYNDVEINSLKQIQLHYFKKYAFHEFLLYITMISIIQLNETHQETTAFAIILLNVIVIRSIKLNFFFGKQGIVGLLRGLIQGMFYCHLFTIIQLSKINEDIIYESIQQQCQVYLHFFHNYMLQYFQIMTDLTYDSNPDLIFAIIIQVLFVINKIELIYEIQFCFNQHINNFTVKKNYLNFKAYLQNHNVNSQLLKKALHNYKFEMKKENKQSDFMIDSQTIKYINYDIQQQIDRIVKTKYFRQAKVFNQFSLNIQEKLIEGMQFLQVDPNEIILNYNQRDDQSIYLIKTGQVKLCYLSDNRSQIPMKILKDQDTFGQVSFFSGLPRTCTVITLGPVQLYKIKRNDLLNAIKSSGQDLETACFIRDQILYNNNFSSIGLKCICCNSSEHLVHSCKYLTYQPNKEKIYSQYLFNHNQHRKKSKYNCHLERRDRIKSQNSRNHMFQLNLIGEEFQENNFQEEEDSKLFQESTSNNLNFQSSSNIQQQGLSRPSFITSRERVASIDKNSFMLANELDDIKEQFHDVDQILLRKDICHHKVQHNQNMAISEIIQELDSEESSSKSRGKQDSHQLIIQNNIKQNNHNTQQSKLDKLQDQFVINTICQRSLQNLNHTSNNTQDYTKSNRQSRKSASYTPHATNLDNQYFWNQMPILSNINLDEKDKNNSEVGSGQPKNKHNKGKLEDNQNQFYVFTNTVFKFIIQSPYYDDIEQDIGNFEKAQNFTIFYPHNNPSYIIHTHNKQKALRSQQMKKSKYTISFVLSDKINFNII